jgi:hypothetical protein
MTEHSNNAVVVEFDDIAFGLALQEQRGYRFVASHPSVAALDGRRFRSLGHVERFARRLAHQARLAAGLRD